MFVVFQEVRRVSSRTAVQLYFFLLSAKFPREELFIQTKYTSLNGQDPNHIPYDKNASIEEQVKQSIAKSLENLGVTYIDSLVLHGPMRDHLENMKVWREFEKAVDKSEVKQIGANII